MVEKHKGEKIRVDRFFFWLYTNQGRFLEVVGFVTDDRRRTLTLTDLQVFTVWGGKAEFGARVIARCRSEFKHDLRAAGFDRAVISFTRVSGANPGRKEVLTMDLSSV
ncbi:hypothetical protein [Stenotrophomonas maltophilia]